VKLHMTHVTQAEDGCDFDFMMPEKKAKTPR